MIEVSVNKSTFLPRALVSSRSKRTSASKLLRFEKRTIRSMSLFFLASPRDRAENAHHQNIVLTADVNQTRDIERIGSCHIFILHQCDSHLVGDCHIC